jgi:hypothetical protein
LGYADANRVSVSQDAEEVVRGAAELTIEMQLALKLASLAIFTACSLGGCLAQDLAPRAYIITPIHSNAITLTYSFNDGNILFNGAVPLTDSSGRMNAGVVTLFHTFSFFGRSANATASLPYGAGNFTGTLMSTKTTVHRSGLAGANFRLSVNLLGGPAMDVPEFVKWRQKTVLGVSFRVIAPTGQYDPTKLINMGANRWSFKSEVGYSHRWDRWVLDGYGGVWFFTTNPDYFSRNQFNPGTHTQSQNPIASFESHLSYDIKPRLWASLDSNFWVGGVTSLNGAENPDTLQKNSRLGGTCSVPAWGKHQSLKFSYSYGAYVQFGGNFQNVSIGWQYSWLGRPQ